MLFPQQRIAGGRIERLEVFDDQWTQLHQRAFQNRLKIKFHLWIFTQR